MSSLVLMFFINKNCNEWAKLVKESRITYIDDLNSNKNNPSISHIPLK